MAGEQNVRQFMREREALPRDRCIGGELNDRPIGGERRAAVQSAEAVTATNLPHTQPASQVHQVRVVTVREASHK